MEDIDLILKVKSFYKTKWEVILELLSKKGLSYQLVINSYKDNIWRLRIIRNKYREKETCLLPLADIELVRRDEFIILKSGDYELYIIENPFLFYFKENDKIILSLDYHRNVGLIPLTPNLGTINGKFCGSFSLTSQEGLFGLGEIFNPCERHSQKIEVWVNDAFGTFTERVYKPLPFLWSTKGYGIFFNTFHKTIHYVGYPQKSLVSYYFEDYSPNLDIFIILGKSPREIIKKYHDITGKPEIPPFWSFGLWMSRCFYWDQEEVLNVAREIRKRKIPCDVINLDGRAWLRHGYQTDFQWDLERFPDPQNLIYELKKLGFKVCLWENPYISEKSPLFKEAENLGYFLKDKEGRIKKIKWVPEEFQGLHNPPPAGIVDLTNPKAREWYKNLHRPLLKMGIDTFKTDFGEEIPEDVIAYNGMTGEELHNYYPLIYNQTVYEVVKEEKGEGLVWGRSGYLGSQKIPVQWGGDTETSYEGMLTSLRGGLSYGLSGGNILWAHDLGGFYGTMPNEKLYIRWSQFALLNSLTRAHGTTPREPWQFGKNAEIIFKKFAYLRYSLLPYLYTFAIKGKENSLPLMRHLVLEFPEDISVWHIDDEYLLGDYLLICPIFDSTENRIVYLPSGTWYDFWEKGMIKGPKSFSIFVPLNRIPIWVKEGAILLRYLKISLSTNNLEEKYLLELWYPKEEKQEIFSSKDNEIKIAYKIINKKIIISVNSKKPAEIIIHIIGLKQIEAKSLDCKHIKCKYGFILFPNSSNFEITIEGEM